MSPIEDISNIRVLVRLGRIRCGIKKEGQHGPYPQAVDYFVCPDQVKAVYGEQPKELDIMFPADELELVAPQWYKCYSYSQGLICKGNGKTCKRKVDTETGDFANRNTKEWALREGICDPKLCPMIGTKQCRRMMSLLFILPQVPGLGVYQLDTSSFYSIVNLNSQLAPDGFIRQFTRGKIAFLPLVLSIGPKEVTPPGVGRQTINILTVTAKVKLADIIRISRQAPSQVLLPTLEEEEPPEDLMPEEVLLEAEKGKQGAPAPEGGGEAPTIRPEGGKKVSEQAEKEEGGAGPAAQQTVLPQRGKKKQKSPAAPGAEALSPTSITPTTIEGEGFSIDLDWLKRSQKALKWSDGTMLSFLASDPFKVTGKTVVEALGKLTREHAERFTRELDQKVENVKPRLL